MLNRNKKRIVENQGTERNKATTIMKEVQGIIKWLSIALVLVVLVLKLTPMGDIVKEVTHSESNSSIFVQMKSEMKAIGEIATFENTYSDYYDFTNYRELNKILLPLTKKEIAYTYNIRIKAGYNLENVTLRFDVIHKKVRVRLPKVEVLNEEFVDRIKLYENISCLNHLKDEDIEKIDAEMLDEALEKAREDDCYEKAEEEMKRIIENIVEKFDYEVIFL